MHFKYLFIFRPGNGHKHVQLTVALNAKTKSSANVKVWAGYTSARDNYFIENKQNRSISDYPPNVQAVITAILDSKRDPKLFRNPRKCFLLDAKTGGIRADVAHKYDILIGADDPGAYGFLHPTKTGGTSFISFVEEYLSDFIAVRGHSTTSSHVLNASKIPIMFVRNPIDRFVSIFRYWRFGSDRWLRRKDWKPPAEDIHEFIAKFDRFTDGEKYCNYFFGAHLEQQSWWLPRPDWDKTLIVRYSRSNLHDNVFELLSHIGLDTLTTGKTLELVNITTSHKIQPTLSEKELAWLRKRYKKDFGLWDDVTNNTDKFKGVFGKV